MHGNGIGPRKSGLSFRPYLDMAEDTPSCIAPVSVEWTECPEQFF